MSLLAPLVAFELRQAVAAPDDEVADFVAPRLALPNGPLVAALAHASDRAWRALAAAILPARALAAVKDGGTADAAWVEDQLRRFSDQAAGRFRGLTADARAACLTEWNHANAGGRLVLDGSDDDGLVRQVEADAHYGDAGRLVAAAARAEGLTAAALAADHPRLARLLREQAGDPPFLAAAFAYFFRREIEANDELSNELMCDGLRRLSAPLAGPLAGLAQALARLGSRFDALAAPQPAPANRANAGIPAHLASRPSPFYALRRKEGGSQADRPARGRSSVERRARVQAEPPGPLPQAHLSATPSRPGPSFVNALGMQFVWAPPGEFSMGSPADEPCRDADERRRRVRITRGFFLGAHPVTRGQFAAFVRATKYVTEAEGKGGSHRGPSGEWKLDAFCNWKRPDFPQDDDHPVVCVSWNDARAFCAWLAATEGQKEGVYRLPTEAEWEYACRAGTETPFWQGDSAGTDQANFNGRADGADGLFREGTTPAWVFPPNPWGLFDVHGNVWEWCADWYGPYAEGDAVDPAGPAAGHCRVLRGGSWRNQPRFLRAAARNQLIPSGRDRDAGFRVCLVV